MRIDGCGYILRLNTKTEGSTRHVEETKGPEYT
jgi:hypothetical protein